jgi:hypothetical protein
MAGVLFDPPFFGKPKMLLSLVQRSWLVLIFASSLLVGTVDAKTETPTQEKPAQTQTAKQKKESKQDKPQTEQEKLNKRAEQQMKTGRFKPIFEALQLTEAQRAALKPIFIEHYQRHWAYLDEHREELRAARKKLDDAKKAGDQDVIAVAQKEYFSIYNAGPNADQNALTEAIRTQLTDEQLKTLDDHLQAEKNKKKKKTDKQPEEPGM